MKILDEELEQMDEPLDTEGAPEATSEEIPTEEPSIEGDEFQEEPPIEEDPAGIDPAESFYPNNEDYDYAPDVHLTGNPNDGIKYPAGSEVIAEEPIPEGELGIQESKRVKEASNKTIKDEYKKGIDSGKSEEEISKTLMSKYDLDADHLGTILTEKKTMEVEKVLTYEEAIAIAKENVQKGKDMLAKAKTLKEGFEDMEVGDDYDIDQPPVDGEEMLDDGMEMPDEEMEPKSEEMLVQDILADAEELYRKVVGEEDFGEEAIEDEEALDDGGLEVSDEMLEAKTRVKEKIKANLKKRALKEKIKAKLKERYLKENVEPDDSIADAESEIEGVSEEDIFFEEAKKRSIERKAYLKKILNEEDTPIMNDQKDVEELMGLKIIKKMGEDPKLVESVSKKFEEKYKAKQSFDFKKLLESGFLG